MMQKEILRLAIPNIISNISIPLLGIIDLAVLGHLESEVYIGAIALGGMIFNILYWAFGFLRMGTSGFTAQAFGADDSKESINILGRSVLVALAGSLSLIMLQIPIEYLSFLLIEGSSEVELLASEYFYIRIWAAPATLSLYAFTGWFIGMQNTRYPMYIAIAVNLINLGLNLMFIYGFGMKSDGVAWGTLIAQYLGLFMAVLLFTGRYAVLLKQIEKKILVKLSSYRRFFMVNKDIFIRTLCLIFVFTFFTSQSASTNDTILAVNTLLLQFFMIFSYLIDGFAYAAEALTGKFIGAGNQGQLRKNIRQLFKFGLAISIIFTLIYLFAGENMLRWLTSNESIVEASDPYFFWVVFIPLISFASFLWDGIYIGATASRGMRNSMIISSVFVFIPVFFIFRTWYGNHALWLALLLFLASRGISQTIMAKKEIYNH